MTLMDITREHVELAMLEADELGRAEFLKTYGFGPATTYLVRHSGRFYDPKALVGVAHQFTGAGAPLGVDDLDATEAVGRLRRLGFEIVGFNGLWWVNQGSTYRQERNGGYVWAPKVTKAGHAVAHHVAVSKLRKGQLIVHYSEGAVRAVGYVAAPPQSVPKPKELTGDAWGEDGYGCEVTYRVLDSPIPKAEVPNRGPDVGPFDRNGDVKQGYLFPIRDSDTFALLEFLNDRVPDLFEVPEGSTKPAFERSVTMATPPAGSPNPIHELLVTAKNIVLEGVPGTGKSFAIERLAAEWEQRTGRPLASFGGKPFAALVMHPSTSYEDFIEGLRPQIDHDADRDLLFDEPTEGTGDFVVGDGFFLRVCAVAVRNPDRDVLVLIDELNRCNVSSVLGDLLLTIEASRRAAYRGGEGESASAASWDAAVQVRLPYSRRIFFVPDNVYVVATTNTTDRSVAPLDQAIRRRFAFYRIEPDVTPAAERAQHLGVGERQVAVASAKMLALLNDAVLAPCLGPDAMLGPSYIYQLVNELETAGSSAAAARVWRYNIVPQVLDVARSYGAEGMFDPGARDEWFAEHGAELVDVTDKARAALGALDTFLRGVGFRIAVEGTGLARGARILSATTPRLDLSDIPLEIGTELAEAVRE